MGKPGHVVTLCNREDSKGTCLAASDGDQVLHGRGGSFANRFFNEVSSLHPVGDRRPQIL